jgi:hypothetical protein
MDGKRILIMASDDDFFAGYQKGYIQYATQHKGTTLTDDAILQIVTTGLMDEQQTDRYNIGYISGWYGAMYNKPYRMEDAQVKLNVAKGGKS